MQKTQLALFPLQLFLLPGETTRLHIFEERYRQLLADCEDIQISFGIPYTEKGFLSGYGCIVELKEVIARHPNGSADIEIEAIGAFKVDRFFMRMGEKLYPGGDVILIDLEEASKASDELYAAFDDYLAASGEKANAELFSPNLTVFDMARLIGLEDTTKIKLLKQSSYERQEKVLIDELRMRILLTKQAGSVIENIFLN